VLLYALNVIKDTNHDGIIAWRPVDIKRHFQVENEKDYIELPDTAYDLLKVKYHLDLILVVLIN
jgi:hypothetical protein